MVNELPLAEIEILMFIEKSSAYEIPKTSLFFFQKNNLLLKKVILFIWL